MYKVLHILSGADGGGISNVVLNYYKNLDREKIQFDIAFLVNSEGYIADEFQKMGSEIFVLPLKSKSVKAYKQELEKILRRKQYDAIHIHENETSFVGLSVAKKMGIKQRIAHSHTSAPYVSLYGDIKRRIGCFLNYYFSSCVMACGVLAGDRIFGKRNMRKKKSIVLPNAIDLEKFKFNQEIRDVYRNELQITDKYVIGMVGRLAPEKNFLFGLKIVKKVHEKLPNAVFLIVGEGTEREEIETFIKINKMEEYVKLLGLREDVANLYQCFDVLIMPSIHEGFPLVAVEGIATGLYVLLSSKITSELECYTSVKYCSLDNLEDWVSEVIKNSCNTERENKVKELIKTNLNIKNATEELERIYLTGIIKK